MCRFFTSLAILAVVSTAKAADDCCLTSGDSSSCPEGKTFIDDVDSYDAETGNTYHACCAGGNIEMELETLLENLDMCGSDVQTTSTMDEEDVDEETTTTTTTSSGGGASDCCLIASDTSCPDGKTYMGKFIGLYRY